MLALYYVVTSTPDMQLNPCIDSILFIVFIEKLVRVRLRFQAHSFSGTNVPKFLAEVRFQNSNISSEFANEKFSSQPSDVSVRCVVNISRFDGEHS